MKTPRDWKSLERHPFSSEYVNIDGPAWDEFVGSLRVNGILNDRRITIHEGTVLDGWQLLRGCIETDIEPKFQQLPEGVDPETFVEVMNDRRRHEDADTIRKRAQARCARVAEARASGMSERAIAKQENVSQTQVHRDLIEATEPGGSVDPPNGEIIGEDGKKRRARTKNKTRQPKQKDDTDSSGGLVDSLEVPVPPGLASVFNKVKAFRDIVISLTSINHQLASFKQSLSGDCLWLDTAQANLKNLKEAVRFGTPYAVCPVCKGIPKTRKADCPCKLCGWLVESTYEKLPLEYRQ